MLQERNGALIRVFAVATSFASLSEARLARGADNEGYLLGRCKDGFIAVVVWRYRDDSHDERPLTFAAGGHTYTATVHGSERMSGRGFESGAARPTAVRDWINGSTAVPTIV